MSVEATAMTPASEPTAPARRLRAWRSPVGLVIAAATALGLALRLYQFTRPGYLSGLTEYDDGSYFGSAVHLLQGIMPYRDFVFVQPPGITLLMIPAALAGKATGTGVAMVIGRILTALASAAGVTLLGLLVRRRGVLATLIACGTLAVFPDSIAASHTVLVEGWLTLFSLLGVVAVFDQDSLASTRRLVWGGVAFGFAGAVEAWAIVPVLVVFALALPQIRRALAFAGGVAAGFAVPVLPFAALSPGGFYRSLITAQIAPRAAAYRVPTWFRLREMTGLSDLSGLGHATQRPAALAGAVAVAAVVAGGFALAALTGRGRPAALDWFALATTAAVVAMFMYPSQFHYHFSAFLAPFLGLAVALPIGRLAAGREPADGAAAHSSGAGLRNWLPAVIVSLALAAFAVVQARAESTLKPYVTPAKIESVAARVPQGACVLTDTSALLVLANRLDTNVPGCSPVLDGLGTDLALSDGLKPSTGAGRVPAVARLWQQAFDHAQYVWLTSAEARRIAWTPALESYFRTHFTLVPGASRGDPLYQRVG